MPGCEAEETLERFLLFYYRSQEVWNKMQSIGFKIDLNMMLGFFFYRIFKEKVTKEKDDLLWYTIYMVKLKLWKSCCKMTTDQIFLFPVMFLKVLKQN